MSGEEGSSSSSISFIKVLAILSFLLLEKVSPR
jgi:hypothetical protein